MEVVQIELHGVRIVLGHIDGAAVGLGPVAVERTTEELGVNDHVCIDYELLLVGNLADSNSQQFQTVEAGNGSALFMSNAA